MTPIYLETGKKRVFAAAMDWPGWCRAGRDEASAIEALAAAAPRYALVARRAGAAVGGRLTSDVADFAVVERLPGSASTDFGVPEAAPACDAEPLEKRAAKRLVDLVRAAWSIFDAVVADAPLELIKGPRGGGRNRDKILDHVVNAEAGGYSRKLGLRLPAPDPRDKEAVAAMRAAVADVLQAGIQRGSPDETIKSAWLPRYAARRIAWHVLDHAWEIEDKRPT